MIRNVWSSLLIINVALFQLSVDSTNRVLKARKMLEEIVAENKGENAGVSGMEDPMRRYT